MSTNISNDVTSNLFSYFQQHIPNFCMDKEKREALCFKERLDIYSKNNFALTSTRSIGSYCISVESIGPKSREFLVHVISSITIDGCIGGSKVISSATEELHCLEEKRIELFALFIQTNDNNIELILEKNFYLSTGQNFYSVQISQNSTCDKHTKSFEILHKDNDKLISDGCNIILMRYLAVTNFHGSLSLNFITIDGKITTCNYDCFCAKSMNVNDINLDVYMIKQTFYENGNVVHENKNLMTTQGKILYFDWIDSPYMMKINPLLDPLICNQDPIIMPLREIWKEDIEMMSRYLNKKTDETTKQEKYLSHHAEISYLIADYVQTLLCRKPDDVMIFTLNYFKTLVHNQTSDDSFVERKYISLEPHKIDLLSCIAEDAMHYILINKSQISKNCINSNGNCTNNTSLASLVSNYSICSFCSSKQSQNKIQCLGCQENSNKFNNENYSICSFCSSKQSQNKMQCLGCQENSNKFNNENYSICSFCSSKQSHNKIQCLGCQENSNKFNNENYSICSFCSSKQSQNKMQCLGCQENSNKFNNGNLMADSKRTDCNIIK